VLPPRASALGVRVGVGFRALAPRVSVDVEDVTVLGEAVDESDDAGRSREDGSPLLERQIGRDDRAYAFMAATDDAVEEISGARVARQVSKLIELCGAPHKSTHVECLFMSSALAICWNLSGFAESDST
jgi:hypothetical protein